MGTLLADRIKLRRKELALSQKELAEGICKQGQISRIENGDYTPGSELLHDLAKKLKVSMDYFFDEQVSTPLTELVDFKKISKTFMLQRNYDSLKYIYELEKDTSHRLSLSDKIYMDWIGSIVDFHCYQKKEEAIAKQEKALETLKVMDINYFQIANTLRNFYDETDNLTKFEALQEDLLTKFNQLNIRTLDELEVFLKFHYNFCRHLWLKKDTEQAIKRITATIKLCQDYRTTYLLADLYLLLGNVSKGFSDKSDVKKYFETAHFLYKHIDDNKEMALTVEHYLAEEFAE